MSLRPRTLRARVAIATALVLAVVLGLVAWIVDDQVRRQSMRALDVELRTDAEAIGSTVRLDGRKIEVAMADRTSLAKFADLTQGRYYQVFAEGCKSVRSASLGEASFPEPPASDLGVPNAPRSPELDLTTTAGFREPSIRRCRLRLAVTQTEEGHEYPEPTALKEAVVVEVAHSLEEVDQARATVRLALGLALPVGLVLGAAAAYLVAGRATSPIRRLSEEARAIGGTAVDARLDATRVEGELHDLAQTLNQAFDRVAAVAARERRFASDASHELRTPIAILRSHLELSLSRARSPEEYRATMRTALDATLRLEQIVRSLLLLARLEGGTLERAPFDLREIVRRAVDALRPSAERAQVRVEFAPPGGPLLVAGDGVLLDRLVANLLENALSHGASGGVVEVEVSGDGACASVVVADRGPGFPAELAPRLFERFARGDGSRTRATGGAGLGLSIARAIARAHGGDVVAGSREGGGARVEIRLPTVPPAVSPPGADASASESAAVSERRS